MSDTAYVPEIEQNLLGAILSGGDHRATLARLTPEHFTEPAHAEIYRLACAAQEQYGTTDMPTTSAPSVLKARISAGVSKFGPA